jgi:hypothetical protein
MPEVEGAPPGIDCLGKTHFAAPKGEPLMLCRIIQTFMTGTIQEVCHMFPVQKNRIYANVIIDALRIGANIDELDGNKRHL